VTVQTKTDRRFRRARRPWRRARGIAGRWLRVSQKIFLIGVLIVGGYQAAALLLAAPFLSVGDIVVSGNSQLSEGEIRTLVSGLLGENILAVDLEGYRQQLVESPWLRDGTLRRVLPTTIEVSVTERHPVALARFTDQLYLVDECGTVIDRHGPRFAAFDLPIIDGLAVSDTTATIVDFGRMALVTRLLDQLSLNPEMLGLISQIDVSDQYDAVVLLSDDPVLLHLGTDKFLERLLFYAELVPALKERVANIDYVDLRFDHRVYVRRVGQTSSVNSEPGEYETPAPFVVR